VCLFTRLADAVPLGKAAFQEGTPRPALHVLVEIVANRGKFEPHKDEPEFTDNRGPACYDNTPPLPQYPGGPAQDGSSHPPASRQSVQLGKLLGTDPTEAVGGSSGQTPSVPGLPLLGGSGSTGAANPGGTPELPVNVPGGGQPQAIGSAAPRPQALGEPADAVTASSVSIANSGPERQLVAGLVADMIGADRSSVPAWSSLLVGPLLRGVEVQVR